MIHGRAWVEIELTDQVLKGHELPTISSISNKPEDLFLNHHLSFCSEDKIGNPEISEL